MVFCTLYGCLASSWQVVLAVDPISADQVRDPIDRAIKLIEHSSGVYLKERECFSCHHQAMSILTLVDARARGFEINHDNLVQQVKRTIEHLRRGEAQYKLGQGQGGRVDTAGYALWGLSAVQWPRDSTTAAVTEYLLQANASSRHWVCSSNRPPTEASDVTTSALALKGLSNYVEEIDHVRADKRRASCKTWLLGHDAKDNEERVFALLAAKTLNDSESVASIRKSILASQRFDGGWCQTEGLESDAYATGTAMYALVQAGMPASDPVYQRGLRFLLDNQQEDASWQVASRSRPFQTYFESGFPHGTDQFISIAASCWATLALLECVPRDEIKLAKLPKLPWAEKTNVDLTKRSERGSEGLDSLVAGSTRALTAEEVEYFERDIRPLLVENCIKCHGEEKQSASLRLDSQAAMLEGGDSGPVIVPRNSARSLLIKAVRRKGDLEMPPDEPMRDSDILKLERWIEMGAPWPKELQPKEGLDHSNASNLSVKNHWAFQPIREQEIPAHTQLEDLAESRSSIDRFLYARLSASQLVPTESANRRTLLRRLSYDVTGLPPTYEEIEAFVDDPSEDAYLRAVDRYISSPRFGQHWARHWLDVARYSDSKGYVYAREERFFIQASNYRDWVIDAFAADMPYDRFVKLQLAADQIAPDELSSQAAMGFMTLGRRFLGVTHDIVDDRIDVVTRGLLGLTVGCARCHDHKFDPIPTADYYSLYGVFNNSKEQRVRIRPGNNDPAWQEFDAELGKREAAYRDAIKQERELAAQRVRHRIADYLLAQLDVDRYPAEGFDVLIGKDDLVPKQVRRFQAFLRDAAERGDTLFVAWRDFSEIAMKLPESEFSGEALLVTERLSKKPPDQWNPIVAKSFVVSPKSIAEVARRYADLFQGLESLTPANAFEQQSLKQIKAFWLGSESPCEVPDEDIVGVEQYFDTRACETLWKLQGEVDRWINQTNLPQSYAVVLADRKSIREPNIFKRGNPKLIGERVPRQFLSILGSQPTDVLESAKQTLQAFRIGSGRLELAEAIADPANPLTARVWVNRVWQHLFGQGLVRTPSDFGVRAGQPSHPELLDWLAGEFLASGQSTKLLIRQLVLTAAYQRSSVGPDDPMDRARAMELDADNKLLWKGVSKRLRFEQQRDTWLAASRELDFQFGGKAVQLFGEGNGPLRRTVYCQVDRQFLSGVLRIFDFANPDLHIPSRSETTVPQQALFGMNHVFSADRARRLASLVQKNDSPSDYEISELFRLVLARDPDKDELISSREILDRSGESAPRMRPETLAWQYGFGKFNPNTQTLESFVPLPHFSGTAWQGGSSWPDGKLGWVQLSATGGHAGNDLDHAVVRRWIAPKDGKVKLRSEATHEVAAGDGVRCTVLLDHKQIAGRVGASEGASTVVHSCRTEINIESIVVKAGQPIDFVVDFNSNLNSDQFQWTVEIEFDRSANVEVLSQWRSERDFSGPTPNYLEPLEQLAQILLLCNELSFVD